MKIVKAETKDLEVIESILKQNHLPHQDIKTVGKDFFLAYDDSLFVGIVGLEKFDNMALLRSMVVKEDYRNKGYGAKICKKLIAYAKDEQINELYLLTGTASEYFKRSGFTEVLRNELPKEIKQTKQFSKLCPCSTTCMTLKI